MGFTLSLFQVIVYMANLLSCYRLAARTKAVLMLTKYWCTGTPHPSVVQTSVLVL